MKITITREQLAKVGQLCDGCDEGCSALHFPKTITLEIPDEQVEKECKCISSSTHKGTAMICGCDCHTIPTPAPELPGELPELPLETDEERDQFSSIQINRKAINKIIRFLEARFPH